MNRTLHRWLTFLSLGLLRVPWVRNTARRLTHRLIARLLRWRSRPLPDAGMRRCVVIAPHPDDETLGCGGTILHRLAGGATVSIVLLTDGSGAGSDAAAAPGLVKRRHAEFLQATGLLGVAPERLYFLELKDGRLGAMSPAETRTHALRLATILLPLDADEVFVTSRDDGSSEHEGAFRLVAAALAHVARKPALREFPVWSWWNPLLLLGPLVRSPRIWRSDFAAQASRKARAIAAYSSQTEPLRPGEKPVLLPLFVEFFSSSREYFIERP